ncbi:MULTISPECIES: arylsulfatase [Hyphobacterium]|uniref:Arylsulfatase n=1 Tax=Hyphobacterium vulgare TaxID=1736751 RepID=A0ABV7A0E5_9PROT
MTKGLFRLLLILLMCFATPAGLAQESRPNIVVFLVDDAALMDFGVYGGEAHTPNIDAIAARGTLFTQHRATPFCAPSRAMLLTGMDHHTAGLGTIREVLPTEHRGQPGYTMALEPGVITLAERLRGGGYRTYMTGKWHLGHEEGDLPIDQGFDRSFLVDASGADNWEDRPYLPYYREAPWFEGREPATLPQDFYSSTFIVDQMIDYLETDQALDEPFFAFVSFLAIHIPVQAPRAFTDRYVETYSVGWEVIREARWQRAQELGLIREGAPMAPPPATLDAWDWDTLSEEERALASRRMAVNAGMLEAMDHEIGRLIDHLRETGVYDNTIFVVTSDNGPEAGDPINGPVSNWLRWTGYNWDLETLGERGSYVAIGPEWAQAASGPSSFFKFHAGEGGLRVPLIMAGPQVPDEGRVEAFTVMADVAPTLLDLAGVAHEVPDTLPMTGRSFLSLLTGETESIYGPDDAIGLETSGQAALYRGQYKLVRNMPPHGDGVWRLYDVFADPGETRDLSDTHPQLMREMRHEYRLYANRVGVLELPEGYQVEQQIGLNIIERMLSFYWGWLLSGLVIIAAGLWALWRFIGWIIRHRGAIVSTEWLRSLSRTVRNRP